LVLVIDRDGKKSIRKIQLNCQTSKIDEFLFEKRDKLVKKNSILFSSSSLQVWSNSFYSHSIKRESQIIKRVLNSMRVNKYITDKKSSPCSSQNNYEKKLHLINNLFQNNMFFSLFFSFVHVSCWDWLQRRHLLLLRYS
jgi:hypothetical protein